ncbi:neurexin-1 [Penaeus vannamei]|uniref:Neurexin-1 n=1 Tax=Penaeus vannamei TaxID=6689 RepID=A0A3R7PD76_PENVA|nr:neurexin-1 [Penaeus vannamei]
MTSPTSSAEGPAPPLPPRAGPPPGWLSVSPPRSHLCRKPRFVPPKARSHLCRKPGVTPAAVSRLTGTSYRDELPGRATGKADIDLASCFAPPRPGVQLEGSPSECEQRDPCMNGGRCYNSERGTLCDCSHISYEGPFCEKERQVEEATFRGREFLWWDLRRTGGQPLASQQDQLSLSFKTRHPAGVLFFTGDGKDYVNVALREGGVLVTLDMGGDPLKVTVRPNSVRFDDNQWHTVTVHRTVKEINGHTSFCTLPKHTLTLPLHPPFHSSTSSTLPPKLPNHTLSLPLHPPFHFLHPPTLPLYPPSTLFILLHPPFYPTTPNLTPSIPASSTHPPPISSTLHPSTSFHPPTLPLPPLHPSTSSTLPPFHFLHPPTFHFLHLNHTSPSTLQPFHLCSLNTHSPSHFLHPPTSSPSHPPRFLPLTTPLLLLRSCRCPLTACTRKRARRPGPSRSCRPRASTSLAPTCPPSCPAPRPGQTSWAASGR